MGSIKMGIGLGLWYQGMPDAATLFEYIDKAEAWGIDSVWLSDHLLGTRQEVAIMPMMAAIAARHRRGQIRVEMDEARAGYVRRAIGTAAGFEVREVVAAVANHPASDVKMACKIGWGNEGGVGHSNAEG